MVTYEQRSICAIWVRIGCYVIEHLQMQTGITNAHLFANLLSLIKGLQL